MATVEQQIQLEARCTDPQTPTKQLSLPLGSNILTHHQLLPPLNPTIFSVNRISTSAPTQLGVRGYTLCLLLAFSKNNPLNSLTGIGAYMLPFFK